MFLENLIIFFPPSCWNMETPSGHENTAEHYLLLPLIVFNLSIVKYFSFTFQIFVGLRKDCHYQILSNHLASFFAAGCLHLTFNRILTPWSPEHDLARFSLVVWKGLNHGLQLFYLSRFLCPLMWSQHKLLPTQMIQV